VRIARAKWWRNVVAVSKPTAAATSSTGADVDSSSGRLAWIRWVISHRIGLVPVLVDEKTHAWLLANPQAEVTIDVEKLTLTLPDGTLVKFPLEGFARFCLLNGVDELGYLLSKGDSISAYEQAHR